jgi:hypothetical protein
MKKCQSVPRSGGVIARGKKGYLIAAFSGGTNDRDVSAGIAELKKGL